MCQRVSALTARAAASSQRSPVRPAGGDAGVPLVPGAAVPRGGAEPSRPAAEVAGGAAEAAGAAAGGARDRRAGARAQHPHIPDEPGEAQGQEEEGEVQEKSLKGQRWTSDQFTLRYDLVCVSPKALVCHPITSHFVWLELGREGE